MPTIRPVDLPRASWLANENGHDTPARNRNIGKIVSCWRMPCQATCVICVASQQSFPKPNREHSAISAPEKPIMQSMSAPRNASNDIKRSFFSMAESIS